MKNNLFLSIFFCFLSMVSCSEQPKQNLKVSESPSFSEVLKSRRSIRNFDATKTISQDEVYSLLLEAQEAPSWANQQPSKYYVAISPEKVDAVRELIGMNKERTAGAPVFIVSTYERDKSGFFRGEATNEIGNGWGAYDNGLSNAYLILQARAMGFDTLIMGMRDGEGLRLLLGISENETVMAVIALGYRAEEPNRPERKSMEEVVKFF